MNRLRKDDAYDLTRWKYPVERPISSVIFEDKGRRYRAVITTHDLLSVLDSLGGETLKRIITQALDYAEEVI